jgi:hypothetical protein
MHLRSLFLPLYYCTELGFNSIEERSFESQVLLKMADATLGGSVLSREGEVEDCLTITI